MKIAVCVKRVPDSETRVKIASDGKSLDEAGVKFILNPYDEFAVEEALRGTAEREIEGGVEIVEFPLPAVLTTDKGLNEPRYPALKGIMAAKKKPLLVKRAALGAGGLEVLGLTPPPQRKEGKVVGEGPAAVPELLRLLREEAKVL